MIEFSRDVTRRFIERHSIPDGTAYYCGNGFGVEQTLELLCRLNRYVLVDLPRRCAPLIARLQRETGASVISDPPPERVFTADLAILEAQPEGRVFSKNCVVYDVRQR
ncbi:MAG: hypothetical protein LBN00_00945 [Oscillospiraceae bacterium]|jgi:hypothetical protein|nr:hypothetical protein [Oscillospiraceae bacterium]